MRIKINLQDLQISVLLTGIFILGFYVSYLGLKLSKIYVKPTPLPNDENLMQPFNEATPAPVNEVNPQKGVYNFLLLGHGGSGHSGGALTDSIIVINVDTGKKSVGLISIPRDLWVTGNHKINSVGVQVGYQNMGGVVQSVTGIPINYYVSIDFGNFVKLIDSLDGVEVNIPVAFEDPFYPIAGQENNTCGFTAQEIENLKTKYTGYALETQFKCRYETLSYGKGPTKVNGTTALKLSRSRHGDSDFGRSLRQFAILEGILTKLTSAQSAGKLDEIIDTLSKMVKTDINIGVIKTLISDFGDPRAYTIKRVQLTTENVLVSGKSSDGQFILMPKAGNLNFSEVKTYIKTNI